MFLYITMNQANTDIKSCFHCNQPVPESINLSLEINGKKEPMCCYGCLAVSEAIIDFGLGSFYKYRTHAARTPEIINEKHIDKYSIYDRPEIQKQFVRTLSNNRLEAVLILGDLVCPACAWLIESRIAAIPHVECIDLNYTTRIAKIKWDELHIKLSQILHEILKIGYRAYPYSEQQEKILFDKERKSQLQRLGLAGLLGMQVMMISIALYFGEWGHEELALKSFLLWICLLLTLPVILYSAGPFYKSAFYQIRNMRPGMDVPVSLGISIAFLGSVWSTVTGTGEIYYDSVVMFTFFLLTGRYLEFMSRKKAGELIDKLKNVLPATTTRLTGSGLSLIEELIPVIDLKQGDKILVRAGEIIPADGIITAGKSSIDESIITGESRPVTRGNGASVIGGSINMDSPLQIQVKNIGPDSVLSRIIELSEKVNSKKPEFTEFANKIGSWFVLVVIVIAFSVAWYWSIVNPALALPSTIAVLVATCPCALALAAPAAFTSAATTLLRSGIAVTDKNAIEIIPKSNHVIFDKTGTLTTGKLKLESVECRNDISMHECLSIATALEKQSEHPVAKSIINHAKTINDRIASDIISSPGEGVSGKIDNNNYYIGTADFILKNTKLRADCIDIHQNYGFKTVVLLASEDSILGKFIFADSIRPDARELISFIKSSGREISLLSGDQSDCVDEIALELGIAVKKGGLKPEDKLQILQDLRTDNNKIIMIGDGINDAPVLAAADTSIAMGGGSDLAKINAKMILLNDNLAGIKTAFRICQKTCRVITQNIVWAAGYNLSIVPVAAMGLVAPWMAAIGMSISSLIVIANALRIGKL